ncbi:MAG: tetratricopeptide repeat protein [Stenotrophomonas sp.]|nr:tetratricopeptide repeat protein [Stenotrophomonas sp.]
MSESTPDDWRRREALLDRLLDLPEGARAAFIAEVACGDAADAAALRRWLAGIERSADYLVPKSASDPIGHEGEVAGNWRALRLIGRGGMGEVWLGERADGLFDRKVAIKFIRGDRPALARNIESERRVLAGLQHPGIVRLLDAGTLADGHPYLVTEHIDGCTLDAWLAHARPGLDARLALFRQVATAVAYAHERLVVHRDIKPGNILVDAGANAHLLDFGIARVLAGDADPDAAATQIALTPEFAAPELIVDNSASVRSDVYALGAVLYFLLCGRPPLALQGLALGAMVARVRDEPPGPATARAPGEVVRGASQPLLSDLDAIVDKALSKSPSARYGTVDALLADIAAACERRPVAARAPSAFDRMRRYLQRHRIGVSVAAALLLSLLGGMAGTLWQAHEARQQQQRAEAEAARATAQALTANAVRDFLISVFESANPEVTLGRTPTALDLVDAGVRQAGSGLAGQPAMQARLFEALGRTYIGLGEYDKSRALLEKAHAAAAGQLGARSEPAVALASALAVAVGHGDGPYDGVIALLEDIVAVDPGASPGAMRQSAIATYQLAALQKRVGRLDASEAHFRRAVEVLRGLGAPAQADLAEALHQYAGLDEARGRRNEAIARLREAIALRERAGTGSVAEIDLLREELANLLGSAGHNDEAVALLRGVVASSHGIYGQTHPRTLLSSSWLARALVRESAYAEADAILVRVLALSRAQFGEDAETTAGARIALAASKFAQGDIDAAIAHGEQVRRYAAAHDGEDGYRTIVTTQNLARLRLANGEYAAAGRIAADVLAALGRIGSGQTADALELMGNAHLYQGDAARARARHRQALQVLQDNGDGAGIDAQLLRIGLAEDERDLGDLAAARGHAHAALEGLGRLDPAATADSVIFARYLLAQFDTADGRCDAAGATAIRAQIAAAGRQPRLPPHARWRDAHSKLVLGLCLRQQGKATADSEALLAGSARWLRHSAIASPHARRQAVAVLRAPAQGGA